MGCGCRNITAFICTLIFMGIFTAIPIVAVLFYDKIIPQEYAQYKLYLEIVAGVFGAIFLLCLIFSFINKPCGQIFVCVFLLIIDLVIIAIGAAIFLFKATIVEQAKNFWQEKGVKDNFEKFFKCKNWVGVDAPKDQEETTTCSYKLENGLIKTIGGVFIGLAVVLLICIILILYLSCSYSGRKDDSSSSSSSSKSSSSFAFGL